MSYPVLSLIFSSMFSNSLSRLSAFSTRRPSKHKAPTEYPFLLRVLLLQFWDKLLVNLLVNIFEDF